MLYYVQNMRDGPPQNNQGSDLPPRAQSAERKYIMSNRNNPARFTVDFVRKQIIGTKTSLNRAKNCNNPEYKELRELMEAHPRFRVAAKKVKQNNSKQTYKKLNFKFIEKYISIQPDSEKIMREYEAVKTSAESLDRSVYPHVKRWFIERFSSEGKPFNMDEATREIENAAAKAGAAA